MYAKINDIEIASKAYQELITTYPESPYSTLARTKLADPTNTDELPLPAATTAVVTPTATDPSVSDGQSLPPPEETPPATIEPVTGDQTDQFELPSGDSQEPSILDSLQTIDADSAEF